MLVNLVNILVILKFSVPFLICPPGKSHRQATMSFAKFLLRKYSENLLSESLMKIPCYKYLATNHTKQNRNIYNNNDDSLILGDRGIAGKEYYPISLNPLLLLHIPPHCTLLIFEIIATPSIPPSILPNIPPNCTLISGNDTHLLQKNKQ